LIEKPRSGKSANVPISDTGTATIGISVARQFCRKRKTTSTTSTSASSSVITISWMPSVTGAVVSTATAYCMSSGKFAETFFIASRMPLATVSAFEPGA
jgi:hypothetical protein